MRLLLVITCSFAVLVAPDPNDATPRSPAGPIAPDVRPVPEVAVWSYDALAVGAMDEEVEGVGLAGAVNVFYGSGSGLSSTGSQIWHRNSPGILGSAIGGAKFGQALAWEDFDDDGFPDLAIGAPGLPSNYGTVSVIYGTSTGLSTFGNQFWSQTSAGIEGDPEIDDSFGEEVAAADFDGDGFADLAVASPYDSAPGFQGGAVNVIYGSAAGLAAAGNQLWHQDSPGVIGVGHEFEQFGSDVAAGDFDADGFADLAVGVSNDDAGGGTGSVNVLFGSASGLSADRDQQWTKAPGIPGSGGGRFGWSLTTGDFDGDGRDDLAVAAILDAVGGAVNVLYGCTAGLCGQGAQYWHLDSPGIPGIAAQFDEFGVALAAGDLNADGRDDLAVGAPGKPVTGHADAGTVTVIYGSAAGLSATGSERWTQASVGIAGSIEASSRFGQSLTAGDFDGDGDDDLAIGASGHSASGIAQAGTVNVIYGCAGGLCAPGDQLWSQASPGIPGVAEMGDHFGFEAAASN